jgi:hypothetical protein
MVAMIADEDDNRLVPKLVFVERIEHPAELRIREAGASAIARNSSRQSCCVNFAKALA